MKYKAELTREHLAGYLPYELQGFVEKGNIPFTLDGIQYYADDEIWCLFGKEECLIQQFTPILYPLSYFTKPIELNGGKFIPSKALQDGSFSVTFLLTAINARDWDETLNANYRLVLRLLEWHFDIHGLIESGLAIDVNTLSDNPYK